MTTDPGRGRCARPAGRRSEEHTSELQSPDTISYAVFCLKKKNIKNVDTRCKTVIIKHKQRTGYKLLYMKSTETTADAYRFEVNLCFFFNDTATTEIYTVSDTLSLHDALPISGGPGSALPKMSASVHASRWRSEEHTSELQSPDTISYAVFCLKKKTSQHNEVSRSVHQPRCALYSKAINT